MMVQPMAQDDFSAKPAMRKVPRQGRSKMLVSAVKETCRKILCHELEAPLTTTDVARLSGVSVGSLYQYFPDIESVVAAVYDDILFESVTSQHHFAVTDLSEMPLQEGLSYIISLTLRFHCQMLELNSTFHRQYHACFDLNECFNRLVEDERDTTWIVSQLIANQQPQLVPSEARLIAAMMIEAMVSTINVAIHCAPEKLADELFQHRLLYMCIGLLATD